ncbi:eukaryotic translation initiation factor 3 subunit F, putative [Plasmodium chabaudi chabaudi]|uniref:Eukaryotic translation initiation factor 3 subunit F, putative n=2 Tax=Plasmodium chabaudi TaxID=5825 RepID=A0A077TNR5_PLACU|nr:eukaryotic translation initiation factor 3 subunit F, putative [Plasmodium chabaudi chabaudi]SCM20251.1 eukaryotic translation initiation factor 3 subunit F, putative [Plasmodium chabaudi adami]SCN59654.1 eukaryotic translation initiation factor 3 subunit F, putative [Plasmodium chabaudi chabaudi]SCN59655.1 eukaryotic translation initiation factor 3 subunit F, putative [Plasmodium chabaudi adami]VTZ68404.1 eukaryotic translation initiation factor 3 subunit F, putative [Plasmodium chabaudi ch|eukprot:XP_742598.1 eukaryotic translation initiation factor 3 subunit 5, putative [Plasmodium chabaudi chabaudi]
MSMNRYNFKTMSSLLKNKTPQHFDIQPHTNIKCIVHPSVIFTILDSYLRRDEDQTHVIGTLMGSIIDTNLVEISDCFVDKHSLNEGGFLQIIKDHHETMYELKQKIRPRDQVVGWFCSGSELSELSCAVHGWFKEHNSISKFYPHSPLNEPIHLLVDASLESGFLNIKAYVQLPINLVKEYFVHFHEIQIELLPCNVERADVAKITDKGTKGGDNNSKDKLLNHEIDENSLKKLLIMLKNCKSYVQDIVDKKRKGNVAIGRYLHKVFSNDPFVSIEKFDSINESILQDNLMISYLSNLAHLQFLIAEKLNASSMQ